MHWKAIEALSAAQLVLGVVAQEYSVFNAASNDSLQWGPYRPNLYFGVRPRFPKSLGTALLWARVEDFGLAHTNVRHTCEQYEGMEGYGWDAYDPRTGGVQTIHDQGNGIDVETHFVKFDGGKGGWGARIKGVPREDAQPMAGSESNVVSQIKTAVWFSVTLEGLGSVLVDDVDAGTDLGFDGDVTFQGQTPDLGDFRLSIIESADKVQHPVSSHPAYPLKPLDRTFVHSTDVPDDILWQAKSIVFASMKTTIEAYVEEYTQEKMPPPWQTFTLQNRPGSGNMHLVQKVFEGPFEFDVLYTPSVDGVSRTSADLTAALEIGETDFSSKYAKLFKPNSPFQDSKYMKLSKSLFSNLIGGIGYFYGDQVIDRSYAEEYEEVNEGFWEEASEARARNAQQLEGPYELFTSIPSRPFFPRGFLWDEGFHLLPILDWDIELTMQIISSWFNTMDEDGWIAREQILGAEARSKVPGEFQVQYPHYANPPTLFLTLEALLDKLDGKESGASVDSAFTDSGAINAWLQMLYPLLQRNFNWYRKTQFGDVKSYDRSAFSTKEAYRWRGRTPQHILTSGLDDYPRAQPPHPGELHTDLISWIGLMSRAIARVAAHVGEAEDAAKYSKITEAILRNIDDLHWDKTNKIYCDATIDDYEESIHVCHKGYISIFPFITGLMGPEHPRLKEILDVIANEDELWSPFGIRSLSKSDELYGTAENYWRSPIWMNMNYLIVKNLLKIATQSGPQQEQARKMYSGLRKNLVDTVYKSWAETGFAWEQYNAETGAGQRTQHFTGWTSLVVELLKMPDLSKKGKGHDEL